jgi:transposase
MTGELEVKNLDHLGIVAGLIDELEIEKIINKNLGEDKREKISLGQTAKAIIINGLGFVSKPLYLFSRFYQDKPVERLIGEGIKAQEINDDKMGRLMDKMYEYGLEKIWLEISLKAVEKFEVKTQYSHLDSTSISVEGKYEKEEEGSLVIHHGYSKDKRPDLKQFLIKLLVSND